ncbi:MAG: bifunctional riboflavin kinase/FAD synthetase [Chitinophagaceae bacterium]|nr:bifunctional riboflavin kinase/FAD synthetase [Chitinophagaceae bacterium]
MIVHTDIQNLPNFKNAVITVGVFDGVHTGHRQIIALMKSEAEKIGGETVLITFDPHPALILQSKADLQLLNTLDEKTALLKEQGINHLIVIPFTQHFSKQTAEEYVDDFLVNNFHPHSIIIGHDHRFGKNRSGDFALLQQKAKEHNFIVKETEAYLLENINVSSTHIRKALLGSDIEMANKFLGYDYFFTGTVVLGNKLGRTIGYPTANIVLNEKAKLVPGNAVYAVHVTHDNKLYKGMMNIGIRPTIAGINRVVEVNIFDFDAEIYGDNLRVSVKNKLRSEVKFDTLNELKHQLGKDREAALKALK